MNVGLDIGYSSVKVAYGTETIPELMRLPIGAAPIEQCVQTLEGTPDLGLGRMVYIDNKPWAAGVKTEKLQGFFPVMDKDYPWSMEYRALFYAALDMLDQPVIDELVTGLPVSQFQDIDSRKRLEHLMSGRHYIRPDHVVEVKRVRVVPQPVGAFGSYTLDSARGVVRPKIDKSRPVLVVDAGHYSLDWVLYSDGWAMSRSNSTSNAGDVVLDDAAKALTTSLGKRVTKDMVRRTVLSGAKPLMVGSQEVDVWPTIYDVADKVVRGNMNAMRGSVRGQADTESINLILVAGGGAAMFIEALTRAFSDSTVVAVPDSIHANARGFFLFSQQK